MENYGYLGMDISKGYADLHILKSNKQPLEPTFRLYDVPEGHKQLELLISQWLNQERVTTLYCGVESTGGYENNWVGYLQHLSATKPLKIARLNPKGVKSLSEAALRRTITDSVSAENIALYLIDFREKIHFLAPNVSSQTYSDGRRHNSLIRMLKKQRTQLSNQLEKLLYQEFAPLMCYCRHGFPAWLLLMLNKHSSVEAMRKAGIAKLSSIKGITEDKAIALLKKVEGTEKKTSSHISAVIKSTSKQILALEDSIKAEKKNLVQRFNQTDDVKLLTSICGLGEQSAVEILIEIEDINRFEDAKKLSAYFGLHPVFKQSGDGKWGNHMSKKGRSEIRAVLFMSGMTAIRYSDLFKRIYANARAKGKNHFNAMGVVMHKLLRVIFGVLKNRTPFNADTDTSNRERAAEKQRQLELGLRETKKKTSVKLERYNKDSATASPISKRHSKKIKSQIQPVQKE